MYVLPTLVGRVVLMTDYSRLMLFVGIVVLQTIMGCDGG